jgi:hypothetical protein
MKLNLSVDSKIGLLIASLLALCAISGSIYSQTSEPAVNKNAPGYIGDCVDKFRTDPPRFVKPETISKEQFVAVVKLGVDVYNSGDDLDSKALIEKFKITQYYIQHCGDHLATNGPLLQFEWNGKSSLPHLSDHGLSFFQRFSDPSKKPKRFSFSPVRLGLHGCFLPSELIRLLGEGTPGTTSNSAVWYWLWQKKVGSKGDRDLRFHALFDNGCLSKISLISEQNN